MTKGLEIVEKLFIDDRCYTDSEWIDYYGTIIEDVASMTTDINGFDYKWDPYSKDQASYKQLAHNLFDAVTNQTCRPFEDLQKKIDRFNLGAKFDTKTVNRFGDIEKPRLPWEFIKEDKPHQ